MACGKLNNYNQFFEYPDKQILANPLTTPSHTFTSMIYVLQTYKPAQENQEIARRYIKSCVEYLFVFDFSKVVDMFFKRSALASVVHTNLTDMSWNKIESQCKINPTHRMLFETGVKKIVSEHQFERINETDTTVKRIKEMVSCRSDLAFVMSILFSDNIVKMRSEKHWYYFLGLVEDNTVRACLCCSPSGELVSNFSLLFQVIAQGYPEQFGYILNLKLGARTEVLIMAALQSRAARIAQPPKLNGTSHVLEPHPTRAVLPVSELVCPKTELTVEEVEDFGILGDVFEDQRNQQQGKRKIHYIVHRSAQEAREFQRKLADLPPLDLGQMGQPLGTPLVGIYHIGKPFGRTTQLVEAQPIPPPPMLPEIAYADEPAPAMEDPFAEREFEPVDYEAWVMDEDPPAKRARAHV